MHVRIGGAIGGILVTVIVLATVSSPAAYASLCEKVATSTDFPHMASSGQAVAVTTTVAGSCTSDGEDYFTVRVDLLDGTSNALLSSNSTPIGYNANNFSVNVRNTATAPNGTESWTITVNTYLVQAGAAWGKSLVNSTTIRIQVGGIAVSEFQPEPLIMVALALTSLVVGRSSAYKKKGVRAGLRAFALDEIR